MQGMMDDDNDLVPPVHGRDTDTNTVLVNAAILFLLLLILSTPVRSA